MDQNPKKSSEVKNRFLKENENASELNIFINDEHCTDLEWQNDLSEKFPSLIHEK